MARHKYSKGHYRPENPAKYKGDTHKIIYRSSWELRYMRYLDTDSEIIKWSSEPFPIEYFSEHDGNYHDYWPDFWLQMKDGSEYIVEVKPYKETRPPRKTKRKLEYLEERRRRYREVIRWRKYKINQAKFAAAESFCFRNNITFAIVTERELGIKAKHKRKAPPVVGEALFNFISYCLVSLGSIPVLLHDFLLLTNSLFSVFTNVYILPYLFGFVKLINYLTLLLTMLIVHQS